MSDDPKNPDYKVGHCRPPRKHRFKKGCSGNPKGRPPKQERSFLPRQLKNDILKVAQSPVDIRTSAGSKTITFVEGSLLALRAKVLAGHYPSIKLFLTLFGSALEDHYDAHEQAFRHLESLEKAALVAGEPVSRDLFHHLNTMRAATRRLGPEVLPPELDSEGKPMQPRKVKGRRRSG